LWFLGDKCQVLAILLNIEVGDPVTIKLRRLLAKLPLGRSEAHINVPREGIVEPFNQLYAEKSD